jgi:hypothetical protein
VLSQREGSLDPEIQIHSVKWELRSSTEDRLEGFMLSKSYRLMAKELETFSRRIIKRWRTKEIHSLPMISMEALRKINTALK